MSGKPNRLGGVGLIGLSLIPPVWALADWSALSDDPRHGGYILLAVAPIIFGAGVWQLMRR
jgi:hypothetical protein